MIAGRRVTDDAALEVVTMVYRGLLNTELVSALHRAGVQATGLSGVDADLLTAHRRRPPVTVIDDAGVERMVDYGHVGDIDARRSARAAHADGRAIRSGRVVARGRP